MDYLGDTHKWNGHPLVMVLMSSAILVHYDIHILNNDPEEAFSIPSDLGIFPFTITRRVYSYKNMNAVQCHMPSACQFA